MVIREMTAATALVMEAAAVEVQAAQEPLVQLIKLGGMVVGVERLQFLVR